MRLILIEKIPDYSSYIQTVIPIVGTILAAVISAYALIKVNRANTSDKVSRAQWAFEMYISFVGTYLASNQNIEDYKKYKGFYLLFYAYADNQIKCYLWYIDKLIKKGKLDKAEKKTIELINIYYQKYRLKKYSNKSKMCTEEQKRKLNIIFKPEKTKEERRTSKQNTHLTKTNAGINT